uniref:Uncharacterized protein n=1 Tax=Mimivirus LCMiAC02 TaxID=2506609 RepID=A0A481Z0X5_9VIRU|nr:MAG: hypothetical protein LCMiAC02_02110 [Mimivirus LCMiAC02]
MHYYDHFAQERRRRGRREGTGHLDRVNEEMRALNTTVLYVNVKPTRSRNMGKPGRRRALRTVFNHVRVKSICRLTPRVGNLRKFMFFWKDMPRKRRGQRVHNNPNGIFRNELHLLGVLIADLMEMREAVQPDEKLLFLHEFLF